VTVFIAILLTALTFAFIVYPLFRTKWRSVRSGPSDRLHELHSRRDTTYSMLKELEFDFQSGILSEDDYRELEAKYKKQGISLLKSIDNLKEGSELDEEIERQVQGLRQGKRQAQGLHQGKGQFCTQCGTKHRESDLFCSQCGTELK
jgi:DNA repair exonuclease SbcCD ATPase subunit